MEPLELEGAFVEPHSMHILRRMYLKIIFKCILQQEESSFTLQQRKLQLYVRSHFLPRIGKSNKVPGIYLSPIRTRLFKQFNTDEKKGKYRTIKVEVNERSNETGINVTNKAQVETHL
ncbi:UNVERIFIED_CONTAM: hypothetical protein NCL1_30295 [Trichonephila clavipes]